MRVEKIELFEQDQDLFEEKNCDEDQITDETVGKSAEKNRDRDNKQQSNHTSLMLQLAHFVTVRI